jgi:membrane protein implicated in regulation of membrane protease activity
LEVPLKALFNWLAAAASLVGLFFTLHPPSAPFATWQVALLLAVLVLFSFAAFRDLRDEWKRAAKAYKSAAAINGYMYAMLRNSGRCDICSRDASWIADARIYPLLKEKAQRGELTFLVHKATPELLSLQSCGAEVIEYGALGFDPVTRFTVVNAGNQSSSYVAIGRRKPNEPHTIEELDSSHPTYSMAIDLVRSIRIANDKFKKIEKPAARHP